MPSPPRSSSVCGCSTGWCGIGLETTCSSWARGPAPGMCWDRSGLGASRLLWRGLPIATVLHAPNEPPGHAVVAGPAQLLQGQPLVARLFQRRDVGWINAVVTRLHQLLGVRRRVTRFLHVCDVAPIDTVIPQA